MLPTLLLLSTLASAGEINAHGFSPVLADELQDPIVSYRAQSYLPESFQAGFMMEYAHQPLVMYHEADGVTSSEDLLHDFAALHFSMSYAANSRLSLMATAPLYVQYQDDEGGGGMQMGDTKLSMPIHVYGKKLPKDDMLGLSVVPFLELPTSVASKYLGISEANSGAVVAVSYDVAKLSLVGNVGAEFEPSFDFYGQDGGLKIRSSVGAGYLLMKDKISLHGEVDLQSDFDPAEVAGTSSPSEAMLYVRGHDSYGVGWTVGGSTALSPGAGAADYRMFAGLNFPLGKQPEPKKEAKDDCIQPEPKQVYVYVGVGDVVFRPVYFDFDQDTVRSESMGVLLETVAALKQNPQIKLIEVSGNADSRGGDDYNVDLSRRRVESVVKFLVEQGVDASRIKTDWYGESKPVTGDCQDEECHALDRRVDFKVLEKEYIDLDQ